MLAVLLILVLVLVFVVLGAIVVAKDIVGGKVAAVVG